MACVKNIATVDLARSDTVPGLYVQLIWSYGSCTYITGLGEVWFYHGPNWTEAMNAFWDRVPATHT